MLFHESIWKVAREWFYFVWMEIFRSWMGIVFRLCQKRGIPIGKRESVDAFCEFLCKLSRFTWIGLNWKPKPSYRAKCPVSRILRSTQIYVLRDNFVDFKSSRSTFKSSEWNWKPFTDDSIPFPVSQIDECGWNCNELPFCFLCRTLWWNYCTGINYCSTAVPRIIE